LRVSISLRIFGRFGTWSRSHVSSLLVILGVLRSDGFGRAQLCLVLGELVSAFLFCGCAFVYDGLVVVVVAVSRFVNRRPVLGQYAVRRRRSGRRPRPVPDPCPGCRRGSRRRSVCTGRPVRSRVRCSRGCRRTNR